MITRIRIALVAELLSGNRSPALARSAMGRIKKLVAEPARVSTLEQIAWEAEARRKALGKKHDAYAKMLRAATAGRWTTRRELEALCAAMLEAAKAADAGYVRERIALTKLLSREEFDAVLAPKPKTREKKRRAVEKAAEAARKHLRKQHRSFAKATEALIEDAASRRELLRADETFAAVITKSLDDLARLDDDSDDGVLKRYDASASSLRKVSRARHAARRGVSAAIVELYVKLVAATSSSDWKRVSRALR